MQKTTTLLKMKLFFRRMLPFVILLAMIGGKINAQPYINGNLSTGATATGGATAPAGYTWSEVQAGNGSAGFGANITANLSLADDFTVPAGQGWDVTKLTFYAYSTGYAGTTSPFNDVRVRIFNTNPSTGSPTPVFGDLTTNVFTASSDASMYRIFNATPGTTRKIWKIEANITKSLGPGHYWIEWMLGNGGLSNFSPASTVVGTVTQAGNNAMQHDVTANTWVNPLVDGVNPQDMPFRVDYTQTPPPPCTAITASVLRANNILFNEGFDGVIPTAGWPILNNSNPVGAVTWNQGGAAGVFTSHSGAGFASANFNSTGTNGTISNWMFSPNVLLNNGDKFSFYTRVSTGGGIFPDRLQVRMSTSGASTNVGTTETSTGDFSTLLLDINPTYSTTAYPEVWTQYTVTVSGVPATGISGRMAFRYFVEDAGAFGNNSNYIGIDDAQYVGSGSPTVCAGSAASLAVNITGGVGPYTVVYNATPGGNATVNNYTNGANIAVTPTVPTTYTLVSVTGFDGCVGTNNSGSATVNINGASTAAVLSQVASTVCLGSTANLKVAITGSGAPYTVVINATPATAGYPRTINNYNSGDYIAITPAVTTTYNLVSVTSTSGCVGTGNSGTPTVTVSPTAINAIVITANPDAPLCAGDPTLLTVFSAGGATGPGTLYAQTGAAGNSPNSQKFEAANAPFDNQGAEDFVIPANTSWTITQVSAAGLYFNGAGPSTSYNVYFYNNAVSNIPGTAVASYTNLAYTGGANPVITIPATVLTAGTYWVSIQANMSFAAGGQWAWGATGTTATGYPWAWQNPGGGFGGPCNSWGNGTASCIPGSGSNLIFNLTGTSITTGPPPVGWTYVWVPAAGLSSTTGSPVGASPMVTTTYTVVGTAPGGCQTSASKTVVVNQRPAVTVNPVSRTNCDSTTATFSVTGTGTNLTYQWQVSPTGAGGPWTNLVNGIPYSNVTTATLTINPVSVLMSGYAYRCVLSGACTPGVPALNVSSAAILTVNSLPVIVITPTGPICGGVAGKNGVLIVAGSAPPPVPGSVTVNSGAISIPVPDGLPIGATSVLNVSTIPANATVTGVRVNFSMPAHTYVADMTFNLKAPNGIVLNLDKNLGGTGNAAGTVPNSGFVNTVISSAGTTALSTASTTPITGTWAADLRNVISTPFYTIGDPTGYTSTATAWSELYSIPNGAWTLAMADDGAGDEGTLTNWSITIDYTTPGGGGGSALSYTWSPAAGLYTNQGATIPYVAGTVTDRVYAAPIVNTVYTVTGTNPLTGCMNSGKIVVNYTPPPPTVNPPSVAMCEGDSAVKLTITSSLSPSPFTNTYTSGPINVAIPEGVFPDPPATAGVSNINVPLPATAAITNIRVTMNITHNYVGDVVAVLKAPNGQILNLDAILDKTNNAGSNFVNTIISSAGTASLSTGTAPFTGTFKADLVGATFSAFGFTLAGGPVGYAPTTSTWNQLYSTPNGNWTLALYDVGAPDQGNLTSWSISFDYIYGPPSSGVWVPNGVGSGLYTDPAATTVYTGTPANMVFAKPAASTTYSVAVATPVTPAVFTNGTSGFLNNNEFNAVTFNVKNNNSFPITLTDIASICSTSGASTVSAWYKVGGVTPTPTIDNANGWFQFGTASITAVGNTTTTVAQPFLSGLTQQIPAGATYGICVVSNGQNLRYSTIAAGTYTFTQGNVDIVTGTGIGYAGAVPPGPLGNTPRGFLGNISYQLNDPSLFACSSDSTKVPVTVNKKVVLDAALPANATVCTDKVATFRAAVTIGSAPISYKWQVSTDNGNNYMDISNGGVYSGATTATLTITAPPVTMSGYIYRAVVQGALPCSPTISKVAALTVNPLPVVVISASPYTRLVPGLTTTLSSTVTPNAVAAGGYVWMRNGAQVGGSTATLPVTVDGLGDYQLTVTDVNGCTSSSNVVSILDSVSGKCYIYPNPTDGRFQVRYYSVANNVLPRTLTVYDAKSDRILTQVYTIGGSYDKMEVDMRKYGKGLYWVEIGDRNGNRITMCRVVIQ